MTSISFSLLDSNDKDEKEESFSPMKGILSPLFGKPKEIGFFSIDGRRNICFNDSQMRYLISPLRLHNINLDLNMNISTDIIHHYITIEKMYQTLHWLLHNKGNQKSNLDFITVRGTLVLILCTPYIKGYYHDQWEICASKFNGTIYFSAIDSDKDIEDNKNIKPDLVSCQSWGYKFEQYMTTDTIDGSCDMDSKNFQMEEFCIILLNKLNDYSVLYKAEIDAVIPHRFPGPRSGNTSCYTELKTCKLIQGQVQSYYFHRYKLVTWWAQSFLAGIPEIVCGMRNDAGIVKDLEIFRVSNLPEKAMGLWSANACLSFCKKFLHFLKRTVIEDDPNVVYKFHYKGEDTIYCSKLICPSSRYTVLPNWYVDGMLEN